MVKEIWSKKAERKGNWKNVMYDGVELSRASNKDPGSNPFSGRSEPPRPFALTGCGYKSGAVSTSSGQLPPLHCHSHIDRGFSGFDFILARVIKLRGFLASHLPKQ